RADDVGAEEFAVPLVADDLDEAVSVAHGPGPPVRAERELADLDVEALFTGLVFGQSDGRDLGVAVRHARDVRVVDTPVRDPGDDLGGDDPLVRRLVREERRTGAVADRVHAGDVRPHEVVDDDEAVLGLDARLVEPDIVDDRRAADGDQHALGLDRLRLPVLHLDGQLDAVLPDVRLLEPGAGMHGDPPLLERRLDDGRGLLVLVREDPVERLDQGDLRAERVVDVGKLESDRAATDDGERLRERLREDGVVRAPDPVAVDLEHRERARARAGRDDDVLRLEDPLLTLPGRRLVAVARVLARVDLDLPAAQETAPPLDVLDLVLPEEEGHALGALLGDLAAPLRGRADVQLQIADLDAEIVEPGREPPGVIRRFEHRLGRDATPVVADAAQLLCLYARDLESELRRPDRGHVTPGPGTQNDDIEGIVRHTSPRGLNSAPWDRR